MTFDQTYMIVGMRYHDATTQYTYYGLIAAIQHTQPFCKGKIGKLFFIFWTSLDKVTALGIEHPHRVVLECTAFVLSFFILFEKDKF
jgi:hypothetical protein